MFQQQAESEGVQPNHSNNMPNSISEEPINQLPSNLGGSAHQSQLFYMQSSSEEPINQLPSNLGGSSHQSDQFFESESEPKISGGGVQPNVNPGGSAHQQQLTEAQIAANYEIGTAEHLKYYQSLHNAAKRGDWESAKSFIEMDPNALTARITVDSKTVWHVAALCDQWEFILKLLELGSSPESIAVQDKIGNTVLHYVAQDGSLKTAKALVQKNADLPQIGINIRVPPLLNSIWSESKELVWYLSSMTGVDLPLDSTTFILRTLILSGYHGQLGSWYFNHGLSLSIDDQALKSIVLVAVLSSGLVLQWIKRLLWKAIVQLAPSINMVRDAKLKHECAVVLVNHVRTQLSNMSFQEIEAFLTNPKSNILESAIKCGIEEIVMTLLLQFPDLINVQVLPFRNILQAAIEYRQENIVNVIKEISTTTTKRLGSNFIESKGVTLHLAGKLAPAFKLFSVSGAALQMQRELQWFKLDDFLESLPKKLIIGLGSLFIAIAALIIAFGATLTIVLNERWHWVFVPITLVASFPVAIFVKLQLPLFIQMARYLAAQRGDWKTAKSFIDHDPNALTAQITAYSQTALHVAAFCSQWGFVLKLLELLSPESITMQDEVLSPSLRCNRWKLKNCYCIGCKEQ
ncbi:hypothetical protein EZV62_003560 [Acer yangbiense]|uniref:Uncharacterized protein n=1 Tax=Acer yangbiense TaxID=1000413 RepID=A0A5C7IHR4_9ROSI|nr:hypothetical protein EZV62_003560 [Acer yangbiense]